jgi:hypothetical protein
MSDNTITAILRDIAKIVASVPNVSVVSDAVALQLADISSALQLCGIYLGQFFEGDTPSAYKYLAMSRRTSDAIGVLNALTTDRNVTLSLLTAQTALIEACQQFQTVVNARLEAKRSECSWS